MLGTDKKLKGQTRKDWQGTVFPTSRFPDSPKLGRFEFVAELCELKPTLT